jgi:hypothetical protein
MVETLFKFKYTIEHYYQFRLDNFCQYHCMVIIVRGHPLRRQLFEPT